MEELRIGDSVVAVRDHGLKCVGETSYCVKAGDMFTVSNISLIKGRVSFATTEHGRCGKDHLWYLAPGKSDPNFDVDSFWLRINSAPGKPPYRITQEEIDKAPSLASIDELKKNVGPA